MKKVKLIPGTDLKNLEQEINMFTTRPDISEISIDVKPMIEQGYSNYNGSVGPSTYYLAIITYKSLNQ